MHNVGNAQTLCRCLKAHICMSDHLISDHLKIAYITCPGPCKCTFERCYLCNKGHMMPKKYPKMNLQWELISLQTFIFQCEYCPTLKLLLAGPAKEKNDIEQDEYKNCFKTVDESYKFFIVIQNFVLWDFYTTLECLILIKYVAPSHYRSKSIQAIVSWQLNVLVVTNL